MVHSFFSPSSESDIDIAFRLAKLDPGDRLMDLGCGDGRVLAAACRTGATSIGIELDAELVRRARTRLAEGCPSWNSVVIEADMYAVDLTIYRPDVIFTYLTHSSLQSLTSSLLRLPPRTRVVAVGTRIPEWIVTKSEGAVFLYGIPPKVARVDREPHWGCPGIASLLPSYKPMATSFQAIHPAGRVDMCISAELAPAAAIRLGRVELPVTGVLAIDLYWIPQPAGTCLHGSLVSKSLGRLPIIGIYSDDPPFGSTSFPVELTGWASPDLTDTSDNK